MLKVRDAAARLGLSISTLNKWRVYGTGPTYLKLGSAVFYDPADLDAWLAERRRTSTWSAGNDNQQKAAA
ncbi:putative DNA-binding transcriptional regulator AlpA [Ancylobacter sp. 3268]|uniref:helix-turn-helix transcriptional regulator n=1 Tax=Ancylobacter sp. 3268 TaxID=2817752 RepID=UPI002859DC07|nr:helix-turn-helix domain-containing protein [Ancylobacter sp. 3268]MDR6955216.1 putative DNA-binding transcriptional regulator AlpA [Ancylobacter sp. 3268]